MGIKIGVAGKVISRQDKQQVPFIIRYDGIFDLDSLYKLIQKWFVDQGFYFEEVAFKHKVPSPAGAEQDYDFRGWRKISEYVKFNIRVFIKLYNLKDIEVIKEGKKKKLSKAVLKISIKGEMELDYKNRFEKNNFLKALRNFYNKYILKEEEGVIGGIYWDQLYYRLFKLHAAIKEHLDMESKGNAYYDMWQYD